MSDQHVHKRRRCDNAPLLTMTGDHEKIVIRETNSSPLFVNGDTGTTTDTPQKGTEMQRRSVSFGSLQVRRYNIEIGNHPSCRNGTPIQLGWSYTQDPTQCLESYEASRQEVHPRRNRKELLLPSGERKVILKNAGHSDQEIEEAKVMKVPKLLEHGIASRSRTISDLSCSHSSLDLKPMKERNLTPISAMRNETWYAADCLTSASLSRNIKADQRKMGVNPLFKCFEQKRPLSQANRATVSNKSKSITILPRASYASLSSSSSSSGGRSFESLSRNSFSDSSLENIRDNVSKSHSSSRVLKPYNNANSGWHRSMGNSYRRVIMPRQLHKKNKHLK
jgi:hypothetical protein